MGNVLNVKVKPMELTWGASGIGFTEGDLELTLEEQGVDITAHQEGTNVLDFIRTGKVSEIAVQLKEVDQAKLDYILTQSGATVTASGATGSVTVWGGSKDFTGVLAQAQKLVLHPVTKAEGDLSEDIAAWKAYPMPESISFSGENPSLLSITFKIFPDSAKAKAARYLVFGDHETGDFSSVS